jgi:hypothetical protein
MKKGFLFVEIYHKRKIGVGDEDIFTVGNNNINLFWSNGASQAGNGCKKWNSKKHLLMRFRFFEPFRLDILL